jgi:hypothetical protein
MRWTFRRYGQSSELVRLECSKCGNGFQTVATGYTLSGRLLYQFHQRVRPRLYEAIEIVRTQVRNRIAMSIRGLNPSKSPPEQ